MLDPKKTPFQFIKDSGEPPVPSLSTCSFPELKDWTPSLDELWDMNVAKAGVVKKFHTLMVGDVREGVKEAEKGLDAILMCGYQGVAPRHDEYGLPIYTVLINLLNWPSGILPVDKAEKERDGEFAKEGVQYEPACKCCL
jgi:hypothetical protein